MISSISLDPLTWSETELNHGWPKKWGVALAYMGQLAYQSDAPRGMAELKTW